MASLPLHARVLRTHPLGETSLIVVLLTAERGLLRAVAKGARGPRSHFRGLLEPGVALSLQLHLKRSGGLHLIGEASACGPPPRPARRLETLSLRLAALELVMKTTEEGEALAGLYPLLEEYLDIFAAPGSGEGEPGWASLFAFEAGLLRLHGLEPSLEECGLCGRSLAGGALRFLPGEGLFACPAHETEGLDLAREERDWLLSIFLARPAALAGRSLPAAVRTQIGRVLHLALSRHLPGYKLPRSLAMLSQARREEAGGDPAGETKERR